MTKAGQKISRYGKGETLMTRDAADTLPKKQTWSEKRTREGFENPALDAFRFAIEAVGHYAPELEPGTTQLHRKYLGDLAIRVGEGEDLNESRATLRGLLRDYRDKVSHYLRTLREDVNSAAMALAEILETLNASDGDQADQLRDTLRLLREAPGEDCDSIRQTVYSAAHTIEDCVQAVRKQHQLSISQFLMEIRMLHKRIDTLESAAAVDMLTHLFPRQEMEGQIRDGKAKRLLLMRAEGILLSATQFGRPVSEELTGAVIRRLRNVLPTSTAVARWNGEDFVAIVDVDGTEAETLSVRIAASLGGPYACLKDGKAVHLTVAPRVKLLDTADSDDALDIVERFFSE
jgi:GGDEF domain-containing protein